MTRLEGGRGAAVAKHVRALETLLGRPIVTVVFVYEDGDPGLAFPGEADSAYIARVLAWLQAFEPPTQG